MIFIVSSVLCVYISTNHLPLQHTLYCLGPVYSYQFPADLLLPSLTFSTVL